VAGVAASIGRGLFFIVFLQLSLVVFLESFLFLELHVLFFFAAL
jgi:hypothetical protein